MSAAPLQATSRLGGGSKRCDHPESVTTINYGLLRTICLTCGDVHIAYREQGGPGTLFRVPSLAER